MQVALHLGTMRSNQCKAGFGCGRQEEKLSQTGVSAVGNHAGLEKGTSLRQTHP